MKKALLQWLNCPECSGDIILYEQDPHFQHGQQSDIDNGSLQCISCKTIFPIINGIPRFVPTYNYTDNFGFQWNLFLKTQLDSYTNTTISRDRFFHQSDWRSDEMNGAIVLDAGCGAGRFAEVVLSTGANVIAIDYSGAVDACWENLKQNPNLHVIQADIYALPFKSDLFDYVYSFGTLQHTPDVKKAFFCLAEKVKNNGKMCVDFYRKDWKIFAWPKYWLRPFTRNLPSESLFKIVKKAVPVLLPLSSFLNRFPKIGYYLKYIIPVANYQGVFPLNEQQLFEWSILDTFDMFSPKYDSPQREKMVRKWFDKAGFLKIEVLNCGVAVVRGVKW